MFANKLHINMEKSCCMHFKPKGTCNKLPDDIRSTNSVKINDYETKEVDETKLLLIKIFLDSVRLYKITFLLRSSVFTASFNTSAIHADGWGTIYRGTTYP